MTKHDWLVAGVVTVCVAVMTAVLSMMPLAWAAPVVKVEVPALPSTALNIPKIHAQVTAESTPEPGKAVKVALSVKLPSGSEVTSVPVTVRVVKVDGNPLSRSPSIPTEVGKVEASVAIGKNWSGTTEVAMPLVWATPPPAPTAATKDAKTPRPARQLSYMMVLSSPLGGQASPTVIQTIPLSNNSTTARK